MSDQRNFVYEAVNFGVCISTSGSKGLSSCRSVTVPSSWRTTTPGGSDRAIVLPSGVRSG